MRSFGPPDRLPIDETAPPRPISPYGESKLAFEKILRWYDEIHGVKFVCLRYFNASGATEKFGEDHRPETHLIPAVLQVALGEKPNVEIYGTDYDTPDGTCIRDYIHILDLANAHILALGEAASGCYNLGTGGGSSVREVIESCRKSLDEKSRRSKTTQTRRPAPAHRFLKENQEGTWLATAIPIPRYDYRERLEMASEVSSRLRKLSRAAVLL